MGGPCPPRTHITDSDNPALVRAELGSPGGWVGGHLTQLGVREGSLEEGTPWEDE